MHRACRGFLFRRTSLRAARGCRLFLFQRTSPADRVSRHALRLQNKRNGHGILCKHKNRGHFFYFSVRWNRDYFNVTFAPTSSSLFLMSSAVALSACSFTTFGAPSTRSFASFKPNPVTSRTTFTSFYQVV